MRVVISAGGTGGHIYPALAIINKIKEQEPSSEFLYIGTLDRMEKNIVPSKNIPYLGVEMKGINRHNPFKNISVINSFRKAIKTCRYEIKKFNPDIVLGIGGYITAPVIYAAHKEGYKTFIHEQNSVPGLSNKFLSRYTTAIGVSLPSTVEYFKKKNVYYTGNPRSEEVLSIKPAKKADFGLQNSKKLVIIVMGSLGSLTMCQKMMEILPQFDKKSYEVLFISGKPYYEMYQKLNLPKNVKILPFLENLPALLKRCDLIVTRAGASTIAEITAIGIPSILVPSPFVTNNHQYKNAKELVDAKGAEILEEVNFDQEHLLAMIDKILMDPNLYKSMKENTKKLGVSDSASRIYQVIKKTVEKKI